MPHFSRGWRDDAVQRSFLEAHLRHWQDPENNPASSHYAGRMLEVPEIALWSWDARPYPFFPAPEDVWSDSENWRRGPLADRPAGRGAARCAGAAVLRSR